MRAASDRLRWVGAAAILVVGAIHVQQYADFIQDVPTIHQLFLLTGLGAGGICVTLALARRAPIFGALAALGGIAMSLGALVSVAISLYAADGLFNYRESSYRLPIVIAIVAEVIAVAALAAYLASSRRPEPAVGATEH